MRLFLSTIMSTWMLCNMLITMVKINEEIAFVSYANLPITEYTAFPPLFSLKQYPYRQGEKLCKSRCGLLHTENEGGKEPFYVEELSSSFIAGL